MSNTDIDFQGNWPEQLRAQVQDLIVQHETGDEDGPSHRATSSTDNAQPHGAHRHKAPSSKTSGERARETGLWIAQHNPSPTGPLYAVGRTSRNGHDALGPIMSTSGSELLNKLRTLLRSVQPMAE